MDQVISEAAPIGVIGAAIGILVGFGVWHLLWWRMRGRHIWSDNDRLKAMAARESTRAEDLSDKVDFLVSQNQQLEVELELRDIERRRMLQTPPKPRAVAELEDEEGRAHRIEIHLADEDARIDVSTSELQQVDGIGPLIAQLLASEGIVSLADLSDTGPEQLSEILSGAGPAFRMHDPSTWPDQARLLNGSSHHTSH